MYTKKNKQFSRKIKNLKKVKNKKRSRLLKRNIKTKKIKGGASSQPQKIKVSENFLRNVINISRYSTKFKKFFDNNKTKLKTYDRAILEDKNKQNKPMTKSLLKFYSEEELYHYLNEIVDSYRFLYKEIIPNNEQYKYIDKIDQICNEYNLLDPVKVPLDISNISTKYFSKLNYKLSLDTLVEIRQTFYIFKLSNVGIFKTKINPYTKKFREVLDSISNKKFFKNLDVTEITNMSGMFHGAEMFNEDISNWDTSKVTNMSYMFSNAKDFNFDISKWNTGNVINMSEMFSGAEMFNCGQVNTQPIEMIWNTSKVTDMSGMFRDAKEFNGFIKNWNTSKVTDMSGMFRDAKEFNGFIKNWNTSEVIDMSGMFHGAEKFDQDISNWDTSKVTDMSYMFCDAKKFNKDINNWKTSNVFDMSNMFHGAEMFNCGQVNTQPIEMRWDTHNVENMANMFCGAIKFDQNIKWNTSKVTDMSGMFFNAKNFNKYIGTWDTSKVENMGGMFRNAVVFNKPIQFWKTGNVKNMKGMFDDAKEFDQDITNWDTQNVKNMADMFFGALKFNQNIKNWNMSKVRNIERMFQGAKKFNFGEVYLGRGMPIPYPQENVEWNLSEVRDMSFIFRKAENFNADLNNWIVGDHVTKGGMDGMFLGTRVETPFIWEKTENVSGLPIREDSSKSEEIDIKYLDIKKIKDYFFEKLSKGENFFYPFRKHIVDNIIHPGLNLLFKQKHNIPDEIIENLKGKIDDFYEESKSIQIITDESRRYYQHVFVRLDEFEQYEKKQEFKEKDRKRAEFFEFLKKAKDSTVPDEWQLKYLTDIYTTPSKYPINRRLTLTYNGNNLDTEWNENVLEFWDDCITFIYGCLKYLNKIKKNKKPLYIYLDDLLKLTSYKYYEKEVSEKYYKKRDNMINEGKLKCDIFDISYFNNPKGLDISKSDCDILKLNKYKEFELELGLGSEKNDYTDEDNETLLKQTELHHGEYYPPNPS